MSILFNHGSFQKPDPFFFPGCVRASCKEEFWSSRFRPLPFEFDPPTSRSALRLRTKRSASKRRLTDLICNGWVFLGGVGELPPLCDSTQKRSLEQPLDQPEPPSVTVWPLICAMVLFDRWFGDHLKGKLKGTVGQNRQVWLGQSSICQSFWDEPPPKTSSRCLYGGKGTGKDLVVKTPDLRTMVMVTETAWVT